MNTSSPSRFHHLPLAPLLATILALVPAFAPDVCAGPITVAEFTFDDGLGGPDAQGWVPYHRFSTKPPHFHVEDFSGSGQEAVPLQGGRSMWCGLAAEDPRACHWCCAPGYGHNWNENLVSSAFAVTGDVTLAFLTDMNIEPGYDYVFVEYEDPAGDWVNLDTYSCGLTTCGPAARSYTVPAADHDGQVRFRFHFDSDGGGDNESPWLAVFPEAFVVDSLTVSDATGVVDFQDFETEALGDTVTADGDWYSERNTDVAGSGLLVDGAATLQESAVFNDTWFWAFYAGSTRDYGCAGHPEQLVVPETRSLVRSPRIDLTHDAQGRPVAGAVDSVAVSFDVYRDIELTEQKTWLWRLQSYADDCLVQDDGSPDWNRGAQKDWHRERVVIAPPPETAELVIDLLAENFNFSSNLCRSHAPLFDNVTVERFGGGVAAAPEPVAPTTAVLLPITPNPFNPATTIRFELRAPGTVTLRVYDLAGRLVRTLRDRESLGAGTYDTLWRGRDDSGRAVSSGTYLCRLSAGARTLTQPMALLR